MTSGQVTRSHKEVQCHVKISIILMHPSHPPFLIDSFRTSWICLVRRVIKHIFRFFYIADLELACHDYVMLSLWENIIIVPIPKTLEISASFYHFCTSLSQYVTIRD